MVRSTDTLQSSSPRASASACSEAQGASALVDSGWSRRRRAHSSSGAGHRGQRVLDELALPAIAMTGEHEPPT